MLYIVLTLFVASSYAQFYCDDDSRVRYTSCSSISSSTTCNKAYQFSWDSLTMVPASPGVPYACIWSAGSCIPNTSIGYCYPSCFLAKTGGPNGKICANFGTRAECAAYYANNGSDKWCGWYQSGGSYGCHDTITCHD